MNYKFDGDKVFFTSDTHFNHTNIIQYCQRPFKSTDEMNEAMIDNWNSVVGEDDTMFHLGDFCLGGAEEWNKILNRLNGRIYLILGNHDLKNIRHGFIERFEHVAMAMRIEIGKRKSTSATIPTCVLREGTMMTCGSCSDTFTLVPLTPE